MLVVHFISSSIHNELQFLSCLSFGVIHLELASYHNASFCVTSPLPLLSSWFRVKRTLNVTKSSVDNKATSGRHYHIWVPTRGTMKISVVINLQMKYESKLIIAIVSCV